MTWSWDISVEVQRRALRWIVTVMFAMAGLVSGAVIETLPRHVHLAILQTLRPAEAALRRLIVAAMRVGTTDLPEVAARVSKAKGAKGKKRGRRPRAGGEADHIPVFPLFDTRKYVGPPRQRTAPGYGPRIWMFDGTDDPVSKTKTPMPDDPVSARRLCLRLLMLKAALDDLYGYAARLRRVLARPSRKWPEPMRRGRPPGYRARGKTPINEVLEECQTLAIWALHGPEPG